MKVWSAISLFGQRPDLFFFALLVIFLPSQLGLHFWPEWALVAGIRVDYLSPTIYFTDILAILLLISNLKSLNLKPNLKTKICLIFLLAFIVVNTLNAINPSITIYKWLKVLEMAGVALYVFRNKEVVAKFLPRLLPIPLFYTLILALAQFLNSGTVGGVFYLLGERTFRITTPGIALGAIFDETFLRPYASFSHPNVLGGFGLVSYILGSSLGLPLVLISFSEGAWIAGVATVLLRKFLSQIHRQILLSMVLISILLMPIGSMVMQVTHTRLPETISNRLRLSAIAGEAFAKSPLIGVGLGNYIPFIPRSAFQGSQWFLQPAHNIFLLVLAETGAIGLALFCLLLFRVLKNSLVTSAYSLMPAVLAVMLTGMFDHYWLTLQQPMLLFAIVIGILF